MNIVIASGKGGTGKTTLAVNLAYYLSGRNEKVRLLDADVEEPNTHVFLPKHKIQDEDVYLPKPVIDNSKCVSCGKCVENCSYNALALAGGKVLFFPELCHACGVCSYLCPTEAIVEKKKSVGKVFSCEADDDLPFYFAYGLLNIGESVAPAVVSKVKEHMADDSINVMDASPGTACPVVEALSGDSYAVLVTEPTPFGLHDLELAANLALDMGKAVGIVINRSDGEDQIIKDFAEKNDIPIVGRIPYSRKYAETYSRGDILVKEHDEFEKYISEIYENIKKLKIPEKREKKSLRKSDNTTEKSDFTKGSAEDYKETVVVSGKGGTGKTSIAASLSQLAESKVNFDADVDAANLELLLSPSKIKSSPFSGGSEYEINQSECLACGKCLKHCHFDAVEYESSNSKYTINPLLCEGCGMCKIVCPADAVESEKADTGELYVSEYNNEALIHAELKVGAENSGKLVSEVRREAANFAENLQMPEILGDGPPGIACPVIAALSNADRVLIVTEPSVSGFHDLLRIMDLIKHFDIEYSVIINKFDLNSDITEMIYKEAEKRKIEVVGKVPFDRNIHDALMQNKTIIEYNRGDAVYAVRQIWEKIKNR